MAARRVALFGLGNMGIGMASNLHKAARLICYDPSPRTRAAAAAAGLTVASSVAEAVKEGGEQVLALVDLRQVGPQNVDVPFLLWLIMTLRSYFPKRLGQVALVDPPPVLFEAVRLQRPFPRLRAPSGGDGV